MNRHGVRQGLFLATSAAVAVTVLAACGNNSGSSAGSNTKLPTYTIGIDAPLSGPYGSTAKYTIDGIQAGVDYANTLGVARFKYVIRDDGGNAALGVNYARQLAQDGVKAILAGTSEIGAIQPITTQYKIFTADGGGFTGIMSKVGTNREYPYAFCPDTACGAPTVLPEVQFLAKVDPHGTIGELYGTDPYGSGTAAFVDPLIKQQFPSLHVVSQSFPLTATSVVSQLTTLKSEGATSLLVWTYGTPLVMVMQSLDSMGWYPWLVGPLGVGDPAVVAEIPAKLRGKAIAGGIAATQVAKTPHAQPTGMNKIYFDLYEKISHDKSYNGLSTVASYEFDFVVILAAAIKGAHSTDPAKMLAWLTAGHVIQTSEGPQKFGPNGAARVGATLATTTVYDPTQSCTTGVCIAPKVP